MTVIAVLAVAFGAIVAVVIVAGALSKARLRRRYRPPGHFVSVGDRRVHVQTAGSTGPTVVFESGLGLEGSLAWGSVVPTISKFARAVTYDRPGYGWSDSAPGPRTALAMVDELRTMLHGMGERPPFILAAHSFGALIARLFAYRYPSEISGLVLIEPAHEDQMERFPEELVAGVDLEKMLRMMKPMKYLFSAGIPALRPRLVPLDIPLAQAPLQTAKAVSASSSRAIKAFLSEEESLQESQRQVRAERSKGLGDIPLVVLAHGKPAPVPAGPAITPDVERRYEETWHQLLRETSEMSSRGEYVVAEDSGHYIQLDDPDVVVAAIERVVTATGQLETLRTRRD